MRSTKHPSKIPVAVKRDKALIRMMQVRSNKLARFAYISKRVQGMYTPKRAAKEKAHTRERKELAIELRDIERTIMRWIGEHTKHPDIYTPTSTERPLKVAMEMGPHGKLRPIRNAKTGMPLVEPISLIESTYHKYIRRWKMNRKRIGAPIGGISPNTINVQRTKRRHTLAQQIQDLEWDWMSRLHTRLFPDTPQPPRRIVSLDRFKP